MELGELSERGNAGARWADSHCGDEVRSPDFVKLDNVEKNKRFSLPCLGTKIPQARKAQLIRSLFKNLGSLSLSL